jgi:hypothetical protein
MRRVSLSGANVIWKNDMGTNPMPMKPKNKGKGKGKKGC